MGLPTGHVTGAPMTQAQVLKAPGVGPQQTARALLALLARRRVDA